MTPTPPEKTTVDPVLSEGHRGENGVSQAPAPPISFTRVGWSTLLSVLVLVFISYHTFDPHSFVDLLVHLKPHLIVLAVVSLGLRVLFGGLRLRYVAQGRMDVMGGIRGQLAWDFFSNVTPSAIGGGPFAAVYVARDRNIPMGEASAIMLFTMLLDQFWLAITIPILLVAMTMIPVFPTSLGAVGTLAFVGVFIGMLMWVGLFGYAVLFRLDFLQKAADLVFRIRWLRRFREKVASEMVQMTRFSTILRKQRPAFYINGILLTTGVWISRFALPLLIVWGTYPGVDKFLFFTRTVAMSVGAMLLPTPGGSGGIEGLYVLFLGPLMPKALVAPTLLVWRILGYYLFLGLGVFLSMHHVQKSIRRRKHAARLRRIDHHNEAAALRKEEYVDPVP